jgi:hypothetical protein
MSVQASILIEFSNLPQEYKSQTDLIKMLLVGGWTFNDCGGTSYLPIGDIDDFDWIMQAQISQNELMLLLEEKEKRKELIGVVLTWQNTNIGGSFLFYHSSEISVSLNVDRKTLYGINNFKMTDSNWYLSRLIPIFYKNNMSIKSFAFDEIK